MDPSFEYQMQQRTRLLLGEEKLNRLKNAHVMIAGLGGVGGHCMEAIVRAGVTKLTLIDFDVVDISNLNRQIIATAETIGQAKIDLAEKRAKNISPNIQINKRQLRLDQNNIVDILAQQSPLAAIIDCIDQIEPKCELLVQAHRLNIPVFSSMGAGKRLDPTKIKLADISHTTHCGLAKKIRAYLKQHNIENGITTVFSTEIPAPEVKKLSTVGSISYMPALFGYTLAGAAIRAIAQID